MWGSLMCLKERVKRSNRLVNSFTLGQKLQILNDRHADARFVSHRVVFTGLELEVLRFVKHRILLHEQLLIELLDYLRERQMRDY